MQAETDARGRAATAVQGAVSRGEAFRVWLKIGLLSFGGPAGQIALMHRLLVDEKKWIGEERFLHALNYCMLLPGPEAQQLAIYVGWLLHRTLGGLVAGILFVLPGAAVMLVLSILYAGFQDLTLVQALFFGIKAAVLAVVVQAVVRIGSRALKSALMRGIASLAFIAIFFFGLPFPLIIAAAALAGVVFNRVGIVRKNHSPAAPAAARMDGLPNIGNGDHTRPSARRVVRLLAVYLTLWLMPTVLLATLFGPTNIYVQEGLFFSKMAVVTFGGAYAVLAYMTQQAVDAHGWLVPGEMLDGLGLAETTPGPLILVAQFVGFLAAYRNPGGMDPMLAGVLGAALTTWVTFVPCFLWIFLGAPYIETLRGNRSLAAALSAITAAVVGVILNLTLWFALHVVFAEVGEVRFAAVTLLAPAWETVRIPSLLLAGGAFIALFRFKIPMIPVLVGSMALGALLFYARL